nr:particulate butane monooxygenase subunit C [Nocardioides sp. CF8]
MLLWRWYQQAFAFTKGLDRTLPEFNQFWGTMFLVNMTVLPLLAGAWYVYLWSSSRKLAPPANGAEEAGRIWRLWLLVAGFTAAVYWGGSYFAEQDASWHQVTMRDSAFTPSHAILFYGVFPLMIYMATGTYLYARTRLPHLYGGKAIPVSFALMIGGSSLLVFQVAMNEFGHSFWEAEELFSASLHWPFVIFGYLLAATFSVWFETTPRLFAIARQERDALVAAEQQMTPAAPAGESNTATTQPTSI